MATAALARPEYFPFSHVGISFTGFSAPYESR